MLSHAIKAFKLKLLKRRCAFGFFLRFLEIGSLLGAWFGLIEFCQPFLFKVRVLDLLSDRKALESPSDWHINQVRKSKVANQVRMVKIRSVSLGVDLWHLELVVVLDGHVAVEWDLLQP